MLGKGDHTMIQSAACFYGALLCAASVLMAVVPPVDAGEEVSVAAAAHVAQKQYEKKSAELALRLDDAAASSQENAAFLYYQALLARRDLDPCTVEPYLAVVRGEPPDARVRVYLRRCLQAIEFAQIASQMPQCNWGPISVGAARLDMNLATHLRHASATCWT